MANNESPEHLPWIEDCAQQTTFPGSHLHRKVRLTAAATVRSEAVRSRNGTFLSKPQPEVFREMCAGRRRALSVVSDWTLLMTTHTHTPCQHKVGTGAFNSTDLVPKSTCLSLINSSHMGACKGVCFTSNLCVFHQGQGWAWVGIGIQSRMPPQGPE